LPRFGGQLKEFDTRAAEAGLSLSDYVLADLRKGAERPTPAELAARIRGRGRVETSVSAARAVRAERDAG